MACGEAWHSLSLVLSPSSSLSLSFSLLSFFFSLHFLFLFLFLLLLFFLFLFFLLSSTHSSLLSSLLPPSLPQKKERELFITGIFPARNLFFITVLN